MEEIAINSGETPTGDTPTGDAPKENIPKGDEPKVEEAPCENKENEKENIKKEEDLNLIQKPASSNIIINNNYFGMNNDENKDNDLAASLNYEVVKRGQFLKRSSFISEKKYFHS